MLYVIIIETTNGTNRVKNEHDFRSSNICGVICYM